MPRRRQGLAPLWQTRGRRPIDIVELFDHLYWVRDRILAAADNAAAPLVDLAPPTLRDLRATLVHELDVAWSWRVRLAGPDRRRFSPDDEDLVATDFPDLAAIHDRWARERGGDARLADDSGRGRPFSFHLQHLYSHAIQQFSDAAVILTAAGHSAGELDFLDFIESTDRRS